MKTRKITEEELRNATLPLTLWVGGVKRAITEIRGSKVAIEHYKLNGEFVAFGGATVGYVLDHYELEVKEPERFYKYVMNNGEETTSFYSDDFMKYWNGKGAIVIQVIQPMSKVDWKKTSNYIEV